MGDFSPRLLGKPGSDYLAMKPYMDDGSSNAADPTTPLPGVSPIQDFINRQHELDVYNHTAPDLIRPQEFVSNIPNPTTLPPPPTIDTHPQANLLMRLYPFLQLLGGVRGANTVLPAVAGGLMAYNQAEDQLAQLDRAYRQQALDAQYARDLKNQELQAENNRYYNSAAGQFNNAGAAIWKGRQTGLENAAKLSGQELSRRRRDVTEQIGQLLSTIRQGRLGVKEAQAVLQKIDDLSRYAVNDLGQPDVRALGRDENGEGLSAEDIGLLTRTQELIARHKNRLGEIEARGDIDKELYGITQHGLNQRQQNEFVFKAKQAQLERQQKAVDNSWHYFEIESANWRASVNKEAQLISLDQQAQKYNRTAQQKANYSAYISSRNAYLDARHAFDTTKSRIDAYYKMAANAGRGFTPDPAQLQQIQADEANLPKLQQQVEESAQDAARDRAIIALPPAPVKGPPPPNTLGNNGPQPPQIPNRHGGDGGSRGEHGAGTRFLPADGGRKSPTSGKRKEVTHQTPITPVSTTKQKVDAF